MEWCFLDLGFRGGEIGGGSLVIWYDFLGWYWGSTSTGVGVSTVVEGGDDDGGGGGGGGGRRCFLRRFLGGGLEVMSLSLKNQALGIISDSLNF